MHEPGRTGIVLLLTLVGLSSVCVRASDDLRDLPLTPSHPQSSFDSASSRASTRTSSGIGYFADDEANPEVHTTRRGMEWPWGGNAEAGERGLNEFLNHIRPPQSKEEWLKHLQQVHDVDSSSSLETSGSDSEDFDPIRVWSEDDQPVSRRRSDRLLRVLGVSSSDSENDAGDERLDGFPLSTFAGSNFKGRASCIFFGAWNMNGQQPLQSDLSAWLSGYRDCGIYAITFQECDVGCAKKSQYIDSTIIKILGGEGEGGITLVSRTQSQYTGNFAMKRVDKSFGRIHGNTRLDIYLRKSTFRTAYVEGNYLLNLNKAGKASIATSLYVDDLRFLFVGVHLSASFSPFTPEKYIEQRNRDVEKTLKGVEQRFGALDSYSGIFLGGDLNYRVDIREKVFEEYMGQLDEESQEGLSIENYRCAKYANSNWIREFLELEKDPQCIDALLRVRESMLSALLVSMRDSNDFEDERARLANGFKNYQSIFDEYDELRKLKAGHYPLLKNWIHDYGLEIVPVKDYSSWPFTFSRAIGVRCEWQNPKLSNAMESARECYQGSKDEKVYGLLGVTPGVAALGRGEMLPAWTDAILSRSTCTSARCKAASMEAAMSAEDSVISSDHLPIRSVHALDAYEKNPFSSLNLIVEMQGERDTHGIFSKERYMYNFYKSLDGCRSRNVKDRWAIQNVSDVRGKPVLKDGETKNEKYSFTSRYMNSLCILVRVPLVKSKEEYSDFDYLVWARLDEGVANSSELSRIYHETVLSHSTFIGPRLDGYPTAEVDMDNAATGMGSEAIT